MVNVVNWMLVVDSFQGHTVPWNVRCSTTRIDYTVLWPSHSSGVWRRHRLTRQFVKLQAVSQDNRRAWVLVRLDRDDLDHHIYQHIAHFMSRCYNILAMWKCVLSKITETYAGLHCCISSIDGD